MRFLLLLVLLACATPPPPKPASLDPSSPDAPEAPLPARSTALDAPKADEPPPAQQEQGDGFTCPMHPEVKQPGPGRCPKCGMDLVPSNAGGGHHHHGGSR